jgi:hypothetical protein
VLDFERSMDSIIDAGSPLDVACEDDCVWSGYENRDGVEPASSEAARGSCEGDSSDSFAVEDESGGSGGGAGAAGEIIGAAGKGEAPERDRLCSSRVKASTSMPSNICSAREGRRPRAIYDASCSFWAKRLRMLNFKLVLRC